LGETFPRKCSRATPGSRMSCGWGNVICTAKGALSNAFIAASGANVFRLPRISSSFFAAWGNFEVSRAVCARSRFGHVQYARENTTLSLPNFSRFGAVRSGS